MVYDLYISCETCKAWWKSKSNVKEIIFIKIKNLNNLHFPRFELGLLKPIGLQVVRFWLQATRSWILKFYSILHVEVNRMSNVIDHWLIINNTCMQTKGIEWNATWDLCMLFYVYDFVYIAYGKTKCKCTT